MTMSDPVVCMSRPGAPAPDVAREEDWVDAARAGDREAFASLYREHARLVHGILLCRVAASDVDDLAQEVFARAIERIATLTESARFGPWLAAIARNAATDHLRLRRSWVSLADESRVGPSVPPQAIEALRMLLTLPECYRETMVLRLVEGMTGPEIALRTGLTAGSVRVNLCRGMKLLRDRLQGGER